jgi:CubicO group peptidase (beta-lactamase class C family)
VALHLERSDGEPARGEAFYCSATINLLGAALVRRHPSIADFAFDAFAKSLDIRRMAVPTMPTPNHQMYLGGGVRLRARDFAKLAQVALDHGTWRGRRVVSADWLATATAAHAGMNNEPDNYGYGWWRKHYQVGGRTLDAFLASGNGGQVAMAIPALDLAITMNAGNYSGWKDVGALLDKLVTTIAGASKP